jgi:hypothetical protein
MVGENVVTSASYAAWVDKGHGSNLLYDILYSEGCVFFARTTQPQTIMHLETSSNVYGRTVNPYNRDLTPGGSSGGESALVGMRGSLLVSEMTATIIHITMRTITESRRAWVVTSEAVCGVHPLMSASTASSKSSQLASFVSSEIADSVQRPTAKRISVFGQRANMAGKETILSTPGPMTVERDALELFMKVAVAAEPWRIDPSITAKAWTPYRFTKPLKIAVQWWDGIVQLHPPMRRALEEVVAACKKAGFEVFDWNCESLGHDEAWDIISGLYWPDGGEEVMNLMNETGEPILPLTKFIIEEQPSVKKMTVQELWEVSIVLVPSIARMLTDFSQDLRSTRCVPCKIRQSLDRHRSQRRTRSRCHPLPALVWRCRPS